MLVSDWYGEVSYGLFGLMDAIRFDRLGESYRVGTNISRQYRLVRNGEVVYTSQSEVTWLGT